MKKSLLEREIFSNDYSILPCPSNAVKPCQMTLENRTYPHLPIIFLQPSASLSIIIT